MVKLSTYSLISPCGMNCGACLAYLRTKNKCPGCRKIVNDASVSRSRCKIKNCEQLQNNNSKFCFDCDEYPCKRLKSLDNRYRTKYHMSMIENLNNIKHFGIRKFVNNENAKHACPTCGGMICVHNGLCVNCDTDKKFVVRAY